MMTLTLNLKYFSLFGQQFKIYTNNNPKLNLVARDL